MLRAILRSLGWLLAALTLYMALVALELYWNLYDWQPKLDLNTVGLIFGILALLGVIWFLARAGRDRPAGVSLLVCLALLVLAVYVVPPEAKTEGLFAREAPSPVWYRAGRFVVLGLPSAFWVLAWRRKRPLPGTPRTGTPPASPQPPSR